MSEIERAIETLLDCFTVVRERMDFPIKDSDVAYEQLVLKILRAELEREKNPLTCDGCKYLYSLASEYESPCLACSRAITPTDRYEPKGEPNV